MNKNPRVDLFDDWSAEYDQDVGEGAFPFIGYAAVLEAVLEAAALEPGLAVLELGAGSGNLTARLVESGAQVLALDFSPKMLAIARAKAPQARFLQADLVGEWPAEVERGRFDRIVSTYLFHEFKQPVKVDLLRRLAHCLNPQGRIVIGDIAFPDVQVRAAAMARWPDEWDEDEEFWAASQDLPALAAGLEGSFKLISSCAGVFVFQVRDEYLNP